MSGVIRISEIENYDAEFVKGDLVLSPKPNPNPTGADRYVYVYVDTCEPMWRARVVECAVVESRSEYAVNRRVRR